MSFASQSAKTLPAPPGRSTSRCSSAKPHNTPASGPAAAGAKARARAGRRSGTGECAAPFPRIPEHAMTDPDSISADYTLRPTELAETLALLVEARQPCVVWGPAGSAKSQIAQQVAAAANRQYVDVRALLLDPVDLRDPLARQRRPYPLGAAGLPASDRRPRPLAHQSRGVGIRGTHGPGGALPARPGPPGRRVRAARGRLADRLQQPRNRPRRRPPHAGPARVALRPPRDSSRRSGLAGLGRREWNRPASPVFRVDAPRAVAPVRPAVAGEGIPVPEDVGDDFRHRAPPERPRSGHRARALPGAPSAKRRPSSSPPSSRFGASCPIPAPSSTIPRTPSFPKTQAR